MKIVVYGPDERVGALEASRVIDLNRAYARYLRDRGHSSSQQEADLAVPSKLENFISAGREAIDAAQSAIAHVSASPDAPGIVQDLSAVKIHAPWPASTDRLRRRQLCGASCRYVGGPARRHR